MFPLPSRGRTPAAQPRLLRPVHASGRTPLKLGRAQARTLALSLSRTRSAKTRAWLRAYVGQRVLVDHAQLANVRAGRAPRCTIGARQRSPPPHTGVLSSLRQGWGNKSHAERVREWPGRDTDLCAPFLSMTSRCSPRSARDGVRTRCRQQAESYRT